MKLRVFIGSSTESLSVARAVQLELDYWAETTIWSQGVFTPSSNTLDSLMGASGDYDFGVFIFTADDILRIRQQEFSTARDNVVFELGLFIGRLGKERTFIILPRGIKDFHLPTDLLGLTYVTFDSNRIDRNLQAALGAPCTQIRNAMEKLGGKPHLDHKRREELEHLVRTTRRIVELHQPSFSNIRILNWKVVHSVKENGDGHLHEELTLTVTEPLYFYLIENKLASKDAESSVRIIAHSAEDGAPLSLLELDRSETLVRHAIFLDPPATSERPKRLELEIERPSIWERLVEKGEDEGLLRASNQADFVTLEFIAPEARKWKAFHGSPQIGQILIEPSRIVWTIEGLRPGRFSYRLFLQ